MSQCVGSAYDILSDSFKLCERVVSIFVEFIKAVFFKVSSNRVSYYHIPAP
jgi:hypothetical protein